MRSSAKGLAVLACTLAAWLSAPALAGPNLCDQKAAQVCQVFEASSGSLSARAVFEVTGDTTMRVVLSNISSADVLAPVDVLTALVFSLRDKDGNLVSVSAGTGASATIASGSQVYYGDAPPDGNVGGEWRTESGGNYRGLNTVITSTGAFAGSSSDPIGQPNMNGSSIWSPEGLDGLQGGLLSEGDNTGTGNGGIGKPNQGLVQDSVEFIVNLAPGSTMNQFDLSRVGALDLGFQYGTSLSEPFYRYVPAPATAALMVAGLFAALALRRRSRKSVPAVMALA